MIHPENPWLAASPDGILDSTKLLEIKCPFKSSKSLTQFLNRPNGDIRSLGEGQYVILPDGKDGHYLQVSKKNDDLKKKNVDDNLIHNMHLIKALLKII